MPGVLGLDLSKTTGVAWGNSGGAPWEWWTIDLNPQGAIDGRHYFLFQKRLDDVLRKWKPELVVFEELNFVSFMQAFRTNCMLASIVIVRCEGAGIPYVGVGASTLKAFAGHGRAKKADMLRFAREKLFGGLIPGRPPTHDEVDAIWLVQWGLERVLPDLRRAS